MTSTNAKGHLNTAEPIVLSFCCFGLAERFKEGLLQHDTCIGMHLYLVICVCCLHLNCVVVLLRCPPHLQGEIGKEMYIVHEGLVAVVGGAEDNEVLAELGPGSIFGEIR